MMLISHVDVVGLHLQPSWQPCLNFTQICLGKPEGGICSVINLWSIQSLFELLVSENKQPNFAKMNYIQASK